MKDLAGNALAADHAWSFTTDAPPPPPPDEGPGGPVLVVTSTPIRSRSYYAEILRAEGLNAFPFPDIAAVTAAALGAARRRDPRRDESLSAAQVAMFTNWVTGGGNLIAMRPDKQLAGLLGLTRRRRDAAGGLPAGRHRRGARDGDRRSRRCSSMASLDLYTPNGASTVATLFSTSTATAHPSRHRAQRRQRGRPGGVHLDLARSIVLTRQGNPAWAGQERDGRTPIRSDDLFFGGATTTDWVDLTKVAIPQADEQQRLLANLIGFVNQNRKPLPRFWYLPNGHNAAVVMTGDDHGQNGTAGRFDTFTAASAPGCSVDDWKCIRATSYIFASTPIPPTQAAAFHAAGFEIGSHINTNCLDFTNASLQTTYTNDRAAFAVAFPGVPLRAHQPNALHRVE